MAYNDKDYQYTYIASATTTQVFSGRGTLKAITINTATAVGIITVIDGTSGTTGNVAIIAAATPGQTLTYDISISQGLRIVTAGASDITVVWGK